MRLSDKYPFLTEYFTTALNQSDRAFPQSIVFYGNDIDSQYILAQEIARLLNCKEDKSDNCSCLNCKWINDRKHPAIMTISRMDNKPEDDDSKTVISVKQSQLIKEILISASEFHRVFIFCDRDDDGNFSGLNPINFQAETATSLLKIIEEPQPGVTFIFLTRYIDDLLPTIISRSQCFFVPSKKELNYNFSLIKDIFNEYWNIERNDVFYISQSLQTLAKENSVIDVLDNIQNYILQILKLNPEKKELIKHIELVEAAKLQLKNGIKPVNIFDDLCLKLIK